MLEMRPLASPQLFCFGTSGSQHPAFIAELVQIFAEEGGLGKGISGVCRLEHSGPRLKAFLLRKEDALVTCSEAGISFMSMHGVRRKAQNHDAWGNVGKLSAHRTQCWQCAALALMQACKGLRVPRCIGQPQRHFPVGVPYLSQPALPSKSRSPASKISISLADFTFPWARAGLGHTIAGLWELADMRDVSESLVSVAAGAGGTSQGGMGLLAWQLTGGAGTCGAE